MLQIYNLDLRKRVQYDHLQNGLYHSLYTKKTFLNDDYRQCVWYEIMVVHKPYRNIQ